MSESRGTRFPSSGLAPSPEIQRLGVLVGRWRSEGHVVGEVPVPITGTDIYEWLPGGFFLVHHVDVVIGEQTVQRALPQRSPSTASRRRVVESSSGSSAGNLATRGPAEAPAWRPVPAPHGAKSGH